ncbi:hypothetical protein LY90DRAFT_673621 [Neocallimastix californiae]|uniref:Uncharacterized protein n=1 Tax=Neocallimastix californiae TaxID=1754190 RepID=A0A1Y2BA14_9FUNG|nr:hypothetical protein LY90DRAFT_673621 [Neocallimastix californiae]|eukprot:ORY31691.1 hypothetical protein LY90DRAFT_673621 [Neocallimastix californiae]
MFLLYVGIVIAIFYYVTLFIMAAHILFCCCFGSKNRDVNENDMDCDENCNSNYTIVIDYDLPPYSPPSLNSSIKIVIPSDENVILKEEEEDDVTSFLPPPPPYSEEDLSHTVVNINNNNENEDENEDEDEDHENENRS